MRESAPNSNPDTQRRRSTRILQAVPLTVIGVDALGRPFQERTSTLIINCHGCRYQSKHYVLKNMWVTLEVPHPEAAHDPRSVRGRVMWIQRPRTVRELFQVGIELEVPGNFWGIAFPPHDWFPFPESSVAEIPAPGVSSPSSQPEEAQSAAELVAGEPESAEDNVRTMPLAAGLEPSLTLARQMTRLVNEARQQLQTVVRESAAQAVSLETQPLLIALQAQVKEVAEQSLAAAARPMAEQALRGAQEAQLDELRHEWDRNLRHSVEEAVERLAGRLVELENERRTAFERQLGSQIQRSIEDLQRMAEDVTARLSQPVENLERVRREAQASHDEAVREAEQRFAALATEARAKLADLESAAREVREQAASSVDAARSSWQQQIEADLAGAVHRWNERVESSLQTAADQASERLSANSHASAEKLEREVSLRIAAMGKAFVEAAAEAERNLGSLRGSLGDVHRQTQDALAQVELTARRLTEQEAQLQTVAATAGQELERRAVTLLEVQSQEIARRAEAALQLWTERLQPALEAGGQQAVARLGAELERALNSRVESVGHLLEQLDSRVAQAEESVRSRQEHLTRVSEQSVQTALDRLQTTIGSLEHEIEDAGRNTAAKWLAEIEGKATETTHTTFESLFKTADWYEKKVQTQMQNTLEKGLDHANATLREKAGEISGLFATELDHYSRSYVEHTQGQLEEAAREHQERMRKHAEELSASSAALISQQARNHTEAALHELQQNAASAERNLQARMNAQADGMRASIEDRGRDFTAQFAAALAQQTQQAVREAREELASQVEYAKDDVRLEGQTQERQFREKLAGLGDQAILEYKARLENASNSWLLTTVTRLNQQSEQHLDKVARLTEERLRTTCSDVFAGIGETLRRRLTDLHLPVPASKSQTGG